METNKQKEITNNFKDLLQSEYIANDKSSKSSLSSLASCNNNTKATFENEDIGIKEKSKCIVSDDDLTIISKPTIVDSLSKTFTKEGKVSVDSIGLDNNEEQMIVAPGDSLQDLLNYVDEEREKFISNLVEVNSNSEIISHKNIPFDDKTEWLQLQSRDSDPSITESGEKFNNDKCLSSDVEKVHANSNQTPKEINCDSSQNLGSELRNDEIFASNIVELNTNSIQFVEEIYSDTSCNPLENTKHPDSNFVEINTNSVEPRNFEKNVNDSKKVTDSLDDSTIINDRMKETQNVVLTENMNRNLDCEEVLSKPMDINLCGETKLISENETIITSKNMKLEAYRCESDSWSDDEDSSTTSDSSSDSDFFQMVVESSSVPKIFPEIKTRGELGLDDLPPIEDLMITIPEEEMMLIGKIHAVVDKLVVVHAVKDMKPLDIDSVLFLTHEKPLGRVYDVFGPVVEPFYCVRFNSIEEINDKIVKIGADIFFAPEKDDITTERGSDASWKYNNEPPEELIDFSDDEQEKEAKRNRMIKNRNRRMASSFDTSAKRPSLMNTSDSQQTVNYEGPAIQVPSSPRSNINTPVNTRFSPFTNPFRPPPSPSPSLVRARSFTSFSSPYPSRTPKSSPVMGVSRSLIDFSSPSCSPPDSVVAVQSFTPFTSSSHCSPSPSPSVVEVQRFAPFTSPSHCPPSPSVVEQRFAPFSNPRCPPSPSVVEVQRFSPFSNPPSPIEVQRFAQIASPYPSHSSPSPSRSLVEVQNFTRHPGPTLSPVVPVGQFTTFFSRPPPSPSPSFVAPQNFPSVSNPPPALSNVERVQRHPSFSSLYPSRFPRVSSPSVVPAQNFTPVSIPYNSYPPTSFSSSVPIGQNVSPFSSPYPAHPRSLPASSPVFAVPSSYTSGRFPSPSEPFAASKLPQLLSPQSVLIRPPVSPPKLKPHDAYYNANPAMLHTPQPSTPIMSPHQQSLQMSFPPQTTLQRPPLLPQHVFGQVTLVNPLRPPPVTLVNSWGSPYQNYYQK